VRALSHESQEATKASLVGRFNPRIHSNSDESELPDIEYSNVAPDDTCFFIVVNDPFEYLTGWA
jgi:hypothetical protein